MIELPQDFPIVERDVVRVAVLDCEGRVLLFHTHDVTAPELGEWSIAAVVASQARFYPGKLPTLLLRFLSGDEIDEPFELWS